MNDKEELNKRLDRIERLLSRIANGLDPVTEKLKIEIKTKRKQKRGFESSKHFEELSHIYTAFVPTQSSANYMTATEVQQTIKEWTGREMTLQIIGAFLGYYFKNHSVYKPSETGSGMKKVWKLKIID